MMMMIMRGQTSLSGLCGSSLRSSWPRMKTTATPSSGKWWKTSNRRKTPRPPPIPKPTRCALHTQVHITEYSRLVSALLIRRLCPPEQKLYTVCDVAMHIIMSKSTTYSLESPKDPVLPSCFFTKPDKVGVSTNCFLFFSVYAPFRCFQTNLLTTAL